MDNKSDLREPVVYPKIAVFHIVQACDERDSVALHLDVREIVDHVVDVDLVHYSQMPIEED
jgi:hypothetical protein